MPATTHLYSYHLAHGRIIEFAGFLMPLSYKGILGEAMAVRNNVGMFDVTHMGRSIIHGDDAERFLDYVSTNNVSSLQDFQGRYSLICNEMGGIKDDTIILRLARDRFLMIYNAANRRKIYEWLKANSRVYNVEIRDVSDSVPMFAVQGPKAEEALQGLTDFDLSRIRRFWCNNIALAGFDCLVSRTGYTGEDGFEIFLWSTPLEKPEAALNLWNAILSAGEQYGIQPCGLGARDVLRLEAGMCLYGNDIDESITPIEACLDFAVKLHKDRFIGKEALVEQKAKGVSRLRVGLKLLEPGVPRPGNAILKGGLTIGNVTSGSFSPTVKRGVAIGYVHPQYASEGEEAEVKIRGRAVKAEVVRFPLYDTRMYGRDRLQPARS